ncbi:hypothetical protein M885DRAFT_569425 [Pelagophyceae sp. CCMP2097]|nr:hypothetical protein M885DRAFT_569425 [Pelagophyceae sp. CCMP2097]
MEDLGRYGGTPHLEAATARLAPLRAALRRKLRASMRLRGASPLGGRRSTMEAIATLHMRSQRTGLHGPRARKELLRALEAHEAAQARAKRADLLHVVDTAFLDARADGLVFQASAPPGRSSTTNMCALIA